jgi:hypothetical protein
MHTLRRFVSSRGSPSGGTSVATESNACIKSESVFFPISKAGARARGSLDHVDADPVLSAELHANRGRARTEGCG